MNNKGIAATSPSTLELFVINFVKDKMTLRVPTAKISAVGMRSSVPSRFAVRSRAANCSIAERARMVRDR